MSTQWSLKPYPSLDASFVALLDRCGGPTDPEMRSLIHGSTRATADEHENFLLNSPPMKIGSLNDGQAARAGRVCLRSTAGPLRERVHEKIPELALERILRTNLPDYQRIPRRSILDKRVVLWERQRFRSSKIGGSNYR